MPSVLLLGASGLLGSHLAARLPASWPTCSPRPRHAGPDCGGAVSWLATRFDAADDASVEAALDEAGAPVVVNAIGLRSGDRASLSAINARFPQRLAAMVSARGGRVVQISSDAVFSGASGGYTEADAPDPLDDYGASKLAGELAPPHLTLRTSFFGRSLRGDGLVEWLMAQRGRAVEGYADYRFSGVSASVLADLIAHAIAAQSALEGVYHVGGEAVDKYALLTALAAQLRIDVTITPVRRGAIDRTLNAGRFFSAVGLTPPTLADSLARLSPCGPISRN